MAVAEAPPPGSPALWPWSLLAAGAAVLLGGSAFGPAWAHGLAELAALPLLFLSVRRLARDGRWRAARYELAILAGICALPLLQLIALPPSIWTRLPGRDLAEAALRTAKIAPPWLPLSLAPQETLRCALALAPPAALFLGALAMGERELRLATAGWLGLALAALALGAAQVLSGETGGPYLYAETPRGMMVGFFANRNHFATLLLGLLPLAAVGAAPGARGRGPALVLGLVFLPLALVGLGVLRSRAGVLLAVPALCACAVILWRATPRGAAARRLAGAAVMAVAAIAAVAAFGLSPIVQRFGAGGPAELRFQAWPHVLDAALRVFPTGGGLGTFGTVYPRWEPLGMAAPTGFEHAHNEYLELLLEAGAAAAALLAAIAIWLARSIGRAWRRRDSVAGAAAVSVLLIGAHAAADYSLRTLAAAALLGFAAGVLAARTGSA